MGYIQDVQEIGLDQSYKIKICTYVGIETAFQGKTFKIASNQDNFEY